MQERPGSWLPFHFMQSPYCLLGTFGCCTVYVWDLSQILHVHQAPLTLSYEVRVTISQGEDITEAALPYLSLLDYLYLFSLTSPQLVSLSPLVPSMDVGLRGRRGVASFVSPFSVFPHFPFSIQGSAKRWTPGCVNAAGEARQKWQATAGTKVTKPGDRLSAEL